MSAWVCEVGIVRVRIVHAFGGNCLREIAAVIFALRRREDGAAARYDLGYFDLERKPLQPLDNPFGPRLSPTS
jgi:hypothetical protein